MSKTPKLTLLTISTGLTNEPLARFIRTANFNGFYEEYDLKIIEGRPSGSGSTQSQSDGQYNDWPLLSDATKLNLLRKAVKVLADKSRDSVILFVDSEASLILGSSVQILDAFKATNASILLSASAEDTCAFYKEQRTTNKNLTANSYTGAQLINFDGFIGYAHVLNELFQHSSLSQHKNFKDVINLVYYENEELRSSLGIQLDSNSTIFYTIKSTDYKNSTNVVLDLNFRGSVIRPKLMKAVETPSTGPQRKTKAKATVPVLVVQANVCQYQAVMPNAILNYYGNYLTPTLPQDKVTLDGSKPWPTITMGIFIERPTPFMEEFFIDLDNLNYDKSRIHLFIHNHFKYNVHDVDAFLTRSASNYASVKYIRSKERVKEWAARKLGVAHALELNTDFYFVLDGKAHLENRNTLKLLVESNKLIIAPLLCYITTSTADLQSIGKSFCNFWGTVDSHGLFKKSIDYKNIATSQHFGIWNVPYISSAYLINSSVLRNPDTRPNYVHGFDDAEVAFATNNRNRGLYMFVTNEFEAGHLVNTDYFEIHHKTNELYQIYDNRYDWEKRYLHPNYYDVLPAKEYGGRNQTPLEPCQDVFWFPIVTERFAKEMIEEMERHGGWADGSIEARGDPYPTVDIQMSEIGFDWHWHEFMRLYIKPLQELVFNGYEVYPPKTGRTSF